MGHLNQVLELSVFSVYLISPERSFHNNKEASGRREDDESSQRERDTFRFSQEALKGMVSNGPECFLVVSHFSEIRV